MNYLLKKEKLDNASQMCNNYSCTTLCTLHENVGDAYIYKNKNSNKFISEQIRNDFIIFYKYLNNSWKPMLWMLPPSQRLPKHQHHSEILNTKIYWSTKEKK